MALSLFAFAGFGVGGVAVAQASSLTTTQISAIVSLLQSFGADQNTINNVSVALGGSTTNSGLTCASFSDVSYGNFDNYPGGRVSQLQTWLGIDPSTFGFGTFGKRTQALWNSRCGGTVTPVVTSVAPNITPVTGVAPLSVFFSEPGQYAQDRIDFGDGTALEMLSQDCAMPSNVCTGSHTYTSAGTYAAKLKDASGMILGTTIITVTNGATAATPSATIDQSSLTTSSSGPTITGSASGVSSVYVAVTAGANQAGTANQSGSGQVPVVNGRWSVTVYPKADIFTAGVYTVSVYTAVGGTLLTTGTLSILGNALQPTATIDQSSLTSTSNTPTITGTAQGVSQVELTIVSSSGVAYGSGVLGANRDAPVVNGRWSFPATLGLSNGSYTVTVRSVDDGTNMVPVTGTLTVTGGSTSATPSATIDTVLARPNTPFQLRGAEQWATVH